MFSTEVGVFPPAAREWYIDPRLDPLQNILHLVCSLIHGVRTYLFAYSWFSRLTQKPT